MLNAAVRHLSNQNALQMVSPKSLGIATALAVLAFFVSCSMSRRLSGTYLAHDERSAALLQLTENDNQQISGVYTLVLLDTPNHVESSQRPVTGTVNDSQISLKFQGGLFGLESAHLAGSADYNRISLETLGANGVASSLVLSRASMQDFEAYSTQLRKKADAGIANRELRNEIGDLASTAQRSNIWIREAQIHLERIAGIKIRYHFIEGKMREVVGRERGTANTVARSQLSVAVSQGEIAGMSTDLQVDALWEDFFNRGNTLKKEYDSASKVCAQSEGDLRNIGIEAAALERRRTVCENIFSTEPQFASSFREVVAKRVELKNFEVQSKAIRQALSREAQNLQ